MNTEERKKRREFFSRYSSHDCSICLLLVSRRNTYLVVVDLAVEHTNYMILRNFWTC